MAADDLEVVIAACDTRGIDVGGEDRVLVEDRGPSSTWPNGLMIALPPHMMTVSMAFGSTITGEL